MSRLQHRSPSLTAIFNALKSESKMHVLDLGSCCPLNYQFFYQFSCRIQYAGFDEILTSDNHFSIDQFKNKIGDFFSCLSKTRKFDVVLGWDILNFMTLEQVVVFFDELRPFIQDDALVYFLLYAGAHSERPSTFRIVNQYFIAVDALNHKVVGRDNLTSVSLLKALPDYYMLRNYRNLQGMIPSLVEHIFCFQSAGHSKRRLPSAEIMDADSMVDETVYSPSINMLRSINNQKSILDLGQKHLLNDDAWSRYFDDVVFEDLRPLAAKLRYLDETESTHHLSSGSFLNFHADKKFDAIVLWDLLTFTHINFLEELGRRLERYCHDGTLLVVMTHTSSLIPDSPLPFLLTQGGLGVASHNRPVDVPRRFMPLTSYQIQKAFPNFYIQETFGARLGMLKGLTEYVFVYKDEFTLARERGVLKQQVIERREKLGLGAL